MKLIFAFACISHVSTSGYAGSLGAPAGRQLYSLRSQFKLRGVAWTLDKVKEMGIVEVELASGVPDLAPDAMKSELDKRGLKAVSSHLSYGRWKNERDLALIHHLRCRRIERMNARCWPVL